MGDMLHRAQADFYQHSFGTFSGHHVIASSGNFEIDCLIFSCQEWNGLVDPAHMGGHCLLGTPK